MSRRCVLAFSASLILPLAVSAQQRWNDDRTRTLVERATERRATQIADTALLDYLATAHGYLTFLAQFGEGFTEPPKIVKADELALEIYWHAPGMSKQRIVGRRDTLLLPTDIHYHRDHLGIVQNNFPSIIRIGEGDEVRDVPHPLSPAGLTQYDFSIRDSLEIRLGPSALQVYEVRFRPKNDREARTVGALYIDRDGANVVRMALGFTRAALLDKDLEDVSIVLENGLIEGRFWLPRRQEVEIRRTASWMDYPARGIIRGRWEICCYRVNAGVPVAYFAGPEIVVAPPGEQAAYKFPGKILDSLPPDVRAVTDADVRQVQNDARALVRSQALARPSKAVLAAASASDFVRFDRVEGLALGTGLEQRFGGGAVAGATVRYGLSDHAWKGRLSAGVRSGTGTTLSIFAQRAYADASDEPETSRARNSIAAQEFGSDYTEPYEVRSAGVMSKLPIGGNWLTFEAAYERHRPLAVNARPVTGRFEPVIAAESLSATRITLELSRPTTLSALGFETSGRLTLTAVRYSSPLHTRYIPGAPYPKIFRPSLVLNLERPFGASRLVLHTLAASVSNGLLPPQYLVYMGGPTTGPGYEFHRFVSTSAVSQRVEWRFKAPFFSVPLGRYGRVPGEITLAPFFNHMWIPPGYWVATRGSYTPAKFYHFPSVGLGVLSLFDIVRFDVAHGLQSGRWTFSADFGRDFWSIL